MENDANYLNYPMLTYFSFREKFHNLMEKQPNINLNMAIVTY